MNISPEQMRRACDQAKDLVIQQFPIYLPFISPALASIQQLPTFLASGAASWLFAQKISSSVVALRDIWNQMHGLTKAALTLASLVFLYADETPMTSVLLAGGSGAVIGHALGERYPVFVRV